MTTREFFEEWLQGKKADLQRSTYEAYTVYIVKHIIPYFEALGKPVEELKPRDINGYVVAKRNGGRQDGKSCGLSSVSVRKHLNIIKQAFREAVLYEIIPCNPASPVRLPKAKESVSTKAQFISLERANDILRAFEGHRMYPLVLITLYYGLRRSEVLGLKWSAIDFENEEIRICHTVVKSLSIEAKDGTKTLSSRRTFPLLEDVKKVLLSIYEDRGESEYIFHKEDNTPLRPDSVTRGFQRVLARNNLPNMRFHDLRHATASILFDRNWSVEDVRQWLGHSDIETTMNIYVTYNCTRKRKIGGAIDGIFTTPKKAEKQA